MIQRLPIYHHHGSGMGEDESITFFGDKHPYDKDEIEIANNDNYNVMMIVVGVVVTQKLLMTKMLMLMMGRMTMEQLLVNWVITRMV